MKYLALAAIAFGFTLASCSGTGKEKAADSDSAEMLAISKEDDSVANINADSVFNDIKKTTQAEDTTIYTTETGLKYMILKKGTGAAPTAEDIVEVHYTGKLTDGTVFDSSVDRGEAATFPLNRVIPGWTEGLQLMKEGGKTIFFIPSKLAYGPNGVPGAIPGNADLVFEVELLKVVK